MDAVKILPGGLKDASRPSRGRRPSPDAWQAAEAGGAVRRTPVVHVHEADSPAHDPSPVADARTTNGGLALSYVVDAGVAYLLVCSAGPGSPLTLLLPTGARPPSGLAVFSRLGWLHARHWALVWGAGERPPTGVDFSSGDLRFRRERRRPAVRVGLAWVAVAEGGYRGATVDPDGPAPCWLPLAQSW